METLAEIYSLPQEYLDFRDTIAQIARARIAPRAAEIDERAEYPHDLRRLLAEQDVLGLPFDTEHGGTGTGTLMLNLAIEEIAKACASTALILMVHDLGTLPIRLFGSEELNLELLGAEEANRQRAQVMDHQDQRRRGAGLGDLLDRQVEHQRAGARAPMLGVEGQAEHVLLGQQAAQV